MAPPDENTPVAASINGNTVINGTLQSNGRLSTGEFVLIQVGTWVSVGEPPKIYYSDTNPQCPQGKVPIAKFWTQPSASTDYGLFCNLPTGWGGNMNPSCEACFDFERCHILYSQRWNAIFCM
ncbi:hypothetical protein FBU30_001124 [Linnemannia zychae]|nr:hypothetical protein FBU30_001124 [Linnemannia zychae]